MSAKNREYNFRKIRYSGVLLFFCLLASVLFAKPADDTADKSTKIISQITDWEDKIASIDPNSSSIIAASINARNYLTKKQSDLSVTLLQNQAEVLKYYFNNGLPITDKRNTILDNLYFFAPLYDYIENNNLSRLLTSDPNLSLRCLMTFNGIKEAETFLRDQCLNNPNEVLRNFDFILQPNLQDIVIFTLCYNAPNSVKRYFSSYGSVNNALNNCNQEYVSWLKKQFGEGGYNSPVWILTDDVFNQKMNTTQASYLVKNRQVLFEHLYEKLHQEKLIGRYSVTTEMSDISKELMRKVNYKTENRLSEPLQPIEFLDEKEMIALLIFADNETGKASFDEIMRLILKGSRKFVLTDFDKLPPENIKRFVDQLEYYEWYVKFIEKLDADAFSFLQKVSNSNQLTAINISDYLPETNTKAPHAEKPEEPILDQTNVSMKLVSHDALSKTDYQTFQLIENPNLRLQNLGFINSLSDPMQSFNVLCRFKPDAVFKNIQNLQTKYYAIKLLECAAVESPNSMKRYLPVQDHVINFYLSKSDNATVQTYYRIYEKEGYKSNAYILANRISEGLISMSMANYICADKSALFDYLAKNIHESDMQDKFTVQREFTQTALEEIRKINDLDADNETKLERLSKFDAVSLYNIAVYGQEEMFNSSFKLFMQAILQRQNGNLYSLFEQTNFTKTELFLRLCATLGQWDVLSAKLDYKQKNNLLNIVVSGLEKDAFNTERLGTVADLILNINDADDDKFIEQLLKSEYERLAEENNYAGTCIYGLLSSLFKDKASASNKAWFKQAAQNFPLNGITRCNVNTVLNSRNQIIARSYFYNDDDGRASYNNFIAGFKQNPDSWVIEDFKTYVLINSKSGNDVQIYANLPAYESEGNLNLNALLTQKQQEPSIVIHRGQSFYTEATIQKLKLNTKLVFLGSCGGYFKINDAMDYCRDAQYIATRQIGSMSVNDPMIYTIMNKLRLNQNLIWNEFWSEISIKLGDNPYKNEYVLPDKNSGVAFMNAYYQLLLNE